MEDKSKSPLGDKEALDRLTEPSNWDYSAFKTVLLALAMMGNGQSVPAHNAPDHISLSGWEYDIKELSGACLSRGVEYSRAIFADIGKKALVMSGKTAIGTESSSWLVLTKQPGREFFQKRIASIHTHPTIWSALPHGFSGTDYEQFLADNEQQAMVICYGDRLLLTLKTTAFSWKMSKETISRRIEECKRDFLNFRELDLEESNAAVVRFNKMICVEFGLSLYRGLQREQFTLNRIKVTE